ncbi:hypothetical protein [Leptospira interrogans]|nr:hypothetical protein [Leptospira interrogans]
MPFSLLGGESLPLAAAEYSVSASTTPFSGSILLFSRPGLKLALKY